MIKLQDMMNHSPIGAIVTNYALIKINLSEFWAEFARTDFHKEILRERLNAIIKCAEKMLATLDNED